MQCNCSCNKKPAKYLNWVFSVVVIIVNVCSLDGTWGSGQSCLGAAAQFCQERNFDETRSASWAACCSILMFPILSYLEAALLLCVLKLRLNDNAAPTFYPFKMCSLLQLLCLKRNLVVTTSASLVWSTILMFPIHNHCVQNFTKL